MAAGDTLRTMLPANVADIPQGFSIVPNELAVVSPIWASHQAENWTWAKQHLHIDSDDPQNDKQNYLVLPLELEKLWDKGVFALLPTRGSGGDDLEFRVRVLRPGVWPLVDALNRCPLNFGEGAVRRYYRLLSYRGFETLRLLAWVHRADTQGQLSDGSMLSSGTMTPGVDSDTFSVSRMLKKRQQPRLEDGRDESYLLQDAARAVAPSGLLGAAVGGDDDSNDG